MNDYDRKHNRNLGSIEKQVDKLYRDLCVEASKLANSVGAPAEGEFFSFNHPRIKKRADKLFNDFQRNIQSLVKAGVAAGWKLANNKNNALADSMIGNLKSTLTDEQTAQYFTGRTGAMEAFQNRKVNGLNLSDRVWKYTNQFKGEIELGLSLGLQEGKGAPRMATELKQYLQAPNNLFRRVRDKYGNLKLSKRAAAYHPGAGVYRSSYQNARRLAATETNIAYRTADHERWQKMDFVVGIRVVLSNNHPVDDICNDLAGNYPKDFKFTGWHPFCRCHAESILSTQEEFLESLKTGKQIQSKNTVTSPPSAFKAWVDKNGEKLAAAEERGNLPYFLRYNGRFWKADDSGKLSGIEAARLRQAARTPEQVADIKARWAERKERINQTYRPSGGNEASQEVYIRKTYKSGGFVETPTIGGQSKQEKIKNERFANILAKEFGYKLRLLPITNTPKQLSPDMLNISNNKLAEIKIPNPTTLSAKSSIQNAIKEASRQKVKEVYIYFDKNVSMQSIYIGLKAALQGGRAQTIEDIIIVFNDHSIKKIKTEKTRKLFKK